MYYSFKTYEYVTAAINEERAYTVESQDNSSHAYWLLDSFLRKKNLYDFYIMEQFYINKSNCWCGKAVPH